MGAARAGHIAPLSLRGARRRNNPAIPSSVTGTGRVVGRRQKPPSHHHFCGGPNPAHGAAACRVARRAEMVPSAEATPSDSALRTITPVSRVECTMTCARPMNRRRRREGAQRTQSHQLGDVVQSVVVNGPGQSTGHFLCPLVENRRLLVRGLSCQNIGVNCCGGQDNSRTLRV